MSQERKFDLEERTLLFAQRVRQFLKAVPRTIANIEDAKQLVRASGSIGANYIEANESLGKKDFLLHLKIARKETKETRFWLQLIEYGKDEAVLSEHDRLMREVTELLYIFNSMIRKSS